MSSLLVISNNCTGNVTNSDFKQAALLCHPNVLAHYTDICKHTSQLSSSSGNPVQAGMVADALDVIG
jgi:hypothetical protein